MWENGGGDYLSLTTDLSKANNKATGPGQHPASDGCVCWQERASGEPEQTAAVHAGTQNTVCLACITAMIIIITTNLCSFEHSVSVQIKD